MLDNGSHVVKAHMIELLFCGCHKRLSFFLLWNHLVQHQLLIIIQLERHHKRHVFVVAWGHTIF
jgi:hypothetical protein